MKRLVFFIAMALIYSASLGQDLIFLVNGEKIEAKITEVSETEIRYKKWSNLSGPIWVKKTSEIERIKYQKDRLLKQWTFKEGERWDFTECKSISHIKSNSNRSISGNEIVSMIDFYYFNAQEDKIKSYVDNLPSNINKNCIQQYYLEQFYHACDDENEQNIIKYGETYMLIDGENELPTVLPVVAKIYALQGNEAKANQLVDEFEQFSKANDDLFDNDIAKLRQETYDLLYPLRFVDDVKGTWVNINSKASPYGAITNPMILIINDLVINNTVNPNGGLLIKAGQGVDLVSINGKQTISLNKPINFSQGVSVNEKSHIVALQFASEDIKDRTWLTDIASIGVESSRQLGADLSATIWSSNAPTSQKVLNSVSTGLFVAAMDNFFKELNYSSRSLEDYKIVITPLSDNVLHAQMSHYSVTADNEGHIYEGDNYQNKTARFVRWEDTDNLMFVSWNGKPITLYPVANDNPVLNEFNTIIRKTSFWRPQYSIPFFVGNATGVYLIYASIERLINLPNYDSFDWGYAGLFAGGITTIIVSSVVPPTRASTKRNRLLRELNEKNLEKLKSKAQTEVSIAPIYNPTNNAVGASVNLSF